MKFDMDKVLQENTKASKEYLKTSFLALKSGWISKSSRRDKIAKLYIALDGATVYEKQVREVYCTVFKEPFPTIQIQKIKSKKLKKFGIDELGVESNQWAIEQQQKLNQLTLCLKDLEKWQDEGAWQNGELFYTRLKSRVEPFDETVCDKVNFSKSFQTYKNKLILEGQREGKEASGKFDALLGVEQKSEFKFDADMQDWGKINLALEESFRAGAWTKGSAKAKLSKTGLSAEAQAAIAIGAQLHLGGTLNWEKDSLHNTIGVQLGGEADLFAGARLGGKAKLTVDAIKGLNLALQADAFAGFEAKCKGTCTFKYDGEDLSTVQATAGVSFGIGGKVKGNIAASLFGPTIIDFESNATLGIGVTVGTKTTMHVDKMALAAKSEFRKLVYIPTIRRGYTVDLVTDDRKNLFYLGKSIKYITQLKEETERSLNKHQDTKVEKLALLV